MTTVTLKIPKALRRDMEQEARKRGVSKSHLLREFLEDMLRRKQRPKPASCLDLVADLVGSQPRPADASTNDRHLEEAMLSDFVRTRKNPR